MAQNEKPIRGKVRLSGTLHCVTGLHIGAQGAGGEIGGLDKPVVRDPITREPYIPGSSLKGKLRALLERALRLKFEHPGGGGTFRHECDNRECPVCRLMGSSGKDPGSRRLEPIPSRVLVRDLRLTRDSLKQLETVETGLLYTEWKFENGLDRVTAAANPRQMERVPAGAAFGFEILYTVEAENEAEVADDLRHLFLALALLQDDTLGGNGSRGYGKVAFEFAAMEAMKVDWYRGEQDAKLELAVTDGDWGRYSRAMAAYFAG